MRYTSLFYGTTRQIPQQHYFMGFKNYEELNMLIAGAYSQKQKSPYLQPQTMPVSSLDLVSRNTEDFPIALCKDKPQCTYFVSFVQYNQQPMTSRSYIVSLSIPKKIQTALSLSRWSQAMKEEMNDLDNNDLVNQLAGKLLTG